MTLMSRRSLLIFTTTAWLALASSAGAQTAPGKVDPDGLTRADIESILSQARPSFGNGRTAPAALPDVDGPGAVLTVGNVFMKVTNWGHLGNLFTNRSNDPAGQWPGASAVSYLSSIRLNVGAVNPTATDPTAVRRVSYLLEWRPATLNQEDRIYRAYDGIINGTRFVNDDGDRRANQWGEIQEVIDEDFLDGHDNDGDGRIDEDHAALGQQLYSLVMRDDTPQAVNTVFNEKHVPLGLECRQKSWAYSIAGFQDFNVTEYEIVNRSGHMLDSLTIGWLVDIDAGPEQQSNFFLDDFDMPRYPSGEFVFNVGSGIGDLPDPERRQHPHAAIQNIQADSALCPRVTLRINGFSVADDNGDEGMTPGVGTFLLINHTTDPLGITGPRDVRFHAFRSFTAGTPYQQGGNPIIDQQRFEFLTGTENIDPETGLVTLEQGDTRGDYIQWVSIGPWRNVADGQSIFATIAFAVKEGNSLMRENYDRDYARYVLGTLDGGQLLATYPSLANALSAQVAFEGINEAREGFEVTDFHGRETALRVGRGEPQISVADCHDEEIGTTRLVTDLQYTWFDFDCNYCTGVYNNDRSIGRFHKTWNAAAPPPNPNLNTSVTYNYADNPHRQFIPAGDKSVRLAWDNLSEVTPDPKTQWYDFRGYRIWKVSDWSRPVGSPGPSESDWRLLGEFRSFNYEDAQQQPIQRNYTVNEKGQKECPMVLIPDYLVDPMTGRRDSMTVPICLDRGDLWNRQNGVIIKPDTTVACVEAEFGDSCQAVDGCRLHSLNCDQPSQRRLRTQYPVGRYTYTDTEVKNGFQYFYSVTAFDSTYDPDSDIITELGGRRSAVESEGVVPQTSAAGGTNVYVVPNPYRGNSRISERPSSWDLTPNSTDPTGTHIDFFGLPPGKWTIRVYTVSGDLVAEIRSDDSINESLRTPVKDPETGVERPGYNRQQDNPNDGQARWNLISRNGQDIVSGIYLFTVDSQEGTQRGRFVVIR